jgi:hypothetical protein
MSKRAQDLTRRVHPFLFFGPPDRGRHHQIWQARDTVCLWHLQAALVKQGYQAGEQIFNMPPEKDEPANPGIEPIALRLGSRDTLLVVTRFPLDDARDDRKRVLRGHTEFEPPVLERARSVFELLNRRAMRLQPHLWPQLRPGFENRANIVYYQLNGAHFQALRTALRVRAETPPPDERTSAFLLHDRLWENGPSLIAAFAMDGTAAIAWSQLLAYQHPDWLARRGFLMVDLIRQPVPARTTLLHFARDWRVEVVLDVRF